jgi:hypothetical protein
MKYSPTAIARLFSFVREASPNKGQRVEAIQRWGGGEAGDSWCCYFVTLILDICFQGQSPIPRLGACQDVYDLAKTKGWIVTKPQKDDIFLYVNSDDKAHHIGIITDGLNGIAGNTSEDGKSVNGTGVFEHKINNSNVKYIRFPR